MKKSFKNLSCLLLSVILASCNNATPATSESKQESSSVSEKQSESSTTSSSVSESSSTQTESSTDSQSESSSSQVEESSSETTSISESSSETQTESSSESTTSEESSPEESSTVVESSSDSSAITPGVISLTNESNVSSSINYGDYNFKLVNVDESDDGYVTLSKGGYVLNTTPFGDIESFKVEYSVKTPKGDQVQSDLGFGGLYYVTDTHTITSPRSYQRVEAPNNTLTTLEDSPNYIAFYTFNEIEIESITINYDVTASYTETFENFDIQLFATNDIHGQVNSDDSHAGLVNASGYIENQVQYAKYNLMFDQGDIYQGSLACYLTEGHIMDDYLLMNGYESTILGNHEFDWMEENIVSHREYSPEVKMLACNVRYKDGTTPSWVKNYYITERGGVKIGVMGAVGDIAGDISADCIENITFITGNQLATMLAGFADELKAAGCDYIILQLHEGSNYSGKLTGTNEVGYDSLNYASLAGKLDLVLESHSHRSYFHTDSYGIKHIQCGGYLSGLGKIKLHVTFNNNEPTITFADSDVTLNNASYLKGKNSEFFEEVNNWYSSNVYKEESERVVATLSADMDKASIEQMQAEAYYALKDRYPELSGYTVSVGGGHIGARSPQKLDKGKVTMSDVTNLFPFDNEMYLVKIGGKDLKYKFLKDSYKLAGLYNASSTIDLKTNYYIIIDSYNYFYMTKQLSTPAVLTIEVNLTEKYGIHPRDAFAMYLADQYPTQVPEIATFEPSTFDYTKSSVSIDVKCGATITASYSNVVDNSTYNEFTIKKTNGKITITCSEGYVITGIDIKQYGANYDNLKFYSDDECTILIQNPSYTTESNSRIYAINPSVRSDTFVISNTSNYDVHLFYINIKVEKDK